MNRFSIGLPQNGSFCGLETHSESIKPEATTSFTESSASHGFWQAKRIARSTHRKMLAQRGNVAQPRISPRPCLRKENNE